MAKLLKISDKEFGPSTIYHDAARQRNHEGYLMLQFVETDSNLFHLKRLFNAGENGRAKQEALVKI